MNITREVIVDLLPAYVSGEASTATRALVEEYLSQNPKLMEEVHRLKSEDSFDFPEATVPPELAMRAVRRTKALIGWQRRLYGWGMFFTLVPFSFNINISGGRIREFHFLLNRLEFPIYLGIGLCCWTAYFVIRRRLSSDLTRPSQKKEQA